MSGFRSTARSETPFEQTWKLTCELYARDGVDVSRRPMGRLIRKLTREEWMKSEEQAALELAALISVAEKL